MADRALAALGELFFPTQLECPYGSSLFESPARLSPGIIRESLDRRWSVLAQGEDYEPGCDIYGLSYIFVSSGQGITRTLVPQALGLRLEGRFSTKQPAALLSLYTKCDVWLQRTVDGRDNAIPGQLNGPLLSEKLIALEADLDVGNASVTTDYENVSAERYYLKNK